MFSIKIELKYLGKITVFDKMKQYFTKLYCPSIAEKVLPVIIYSAVCQKFVKLEKLNTTRYRLNLLLQWEYGWFKSSILERVGGWFPLNTNLLTTSSSAALRGSFVDSKFYVPELLLADIMIMPEFSAVVAADDDILTSLLIALEDADIRIALIKAGRLSEKEKLRVESYGAKIINDRLCYRNPATIWTATHTIDNIPESHRDAFISRFYVLHLKPSEIPEHIAWNDPKDIVDIDLENDFAEWISERYNRPTEPDHSFAKIVLNVIRGKYVRGKKRPRQVGDLRRMIMAHHDLFPDESTEIVADKMKNFIETYEGLTSRELIANYIYQNPRTAKEIMDYTGLKKAGVFSQIKRMGCLSFGSNPRKYYLDSIPRKIRKGRRPKKKVEEVKA